MAAKVAVKVLYLPNGIHTHIQSWHVQCTRRWGEGRREGRGGGRGGERGGREGGLSDDPRTVMVTLQSRTTPSTHTVML